MDMDMDMAGPIEGGAPANLVYFYNSFSRAHAQTLHGLGGRSERRVRPGLVR